MTVNVSIPELSLRSNPGLRLANGFGVSAEGIIPKPIASKRV